MLPFLGPEGYYWGWDLGLLLGFGSRAGVNLPIVTAGMTTRRLGAGADQLQRCQVVL